MTRYNFEEHYRNGSSVVYSLDGRELKAETLSAISEAILESHRANVPRPKQAVSIWASRSNGGHILGIAPEGRQ